MCLISFLKQYSSFLRTYFLGLLFFCTHPHPPIILIFQLPVEIETHVVQCQPGLSKALYVSQNVDLSLCGSLLQNPLTLDLHLLQLQLLLWKLSQRSLWTRAAL